MFNVLCPHLSKVYLHFVQTAVEQRVQPVYNTDTYDNINLLLLPGGSDVNPARYGGDFSLCHDVMPALDEWEQKHIRKAIEYNIPIFAICRGSQSLWVELGGILREHIWPEHLSTIKFPKSTHFIAGRWGKCLVNSFHHQAAGGPSPGNVVVDMIAEDGTVEAYHLGKNICGVQWHPEGMYHDLWAPVLRATIDGKVDKIRNLEHPVRLVFSPNMERYYNEKGLLDNGQYREL